MARAKIGSRRLSPSAVRDLIEENLPAGWTWGVEFHARQYYGRAYDANAALKVEGWPAKSVAAATASLAEAIIRRNPPPTWPYAGNVDEFLGLLVAWFLRDNAHARLMPRDLKRDLVARNLAHPPDLPATLDNSKGMFG